MSPSMIFFAIFDVWSISKVLFYTELSAVYTDMKNVYINT